MNARKLNEMISGDFGKVVMIRGKAEIHRKLLKLGITAGRIIHVISRNLSPEAATVTVAIDDNIRSISCDVAARIKMDVKC